MADAAPPFPGVIKHYRLIRELGRGGMGMVIEGEDRRDGSRVAVKLLHPHLAAADASFRDRFEREAHVAALLRSPYTVPLIDYGEDQGYYFLVMEFVEGESLAAVIARGPLSPERALRIAGEVARALEEAGARGVVHRDIKPENILLNREGRVKVADFGIARQAVSPGMTMAGGFVGTAEYAAPEQALGESDQRSDIYALGVTLYTMLAGFPPFTGRSVTEVLRQHRDAPLPMAALAHLPDPVTNIVRRCLEKDPLDRYQSASDLAGALERARNALARLTPPPMSAAPVVAATPSPSDPGPTIAAAAANDDEQTVAASPSVDEPRPTIAPAPLTPVATPSPAPAPTLVHPTPPPFTPPPVVVPTLAGTAVPAAEEVAPAALAPLPLAGQPAPGGAVSQAGEEGGRLRRQRILVLAAAAVAVAVSAGGIAVGLSSGGGDRAASETPVVTATGATIGETPTTAAASATTATQSATAVAVITPEPGGFSTLSSGARARVITPECTARQWTRPSEATTGGNAVLRTLCQGDLVTVIGGAPEVETRAVADGFTWWKVKADSGGDYGWVKEVASDGTGRQLAVQFKAPEQVIDPAKFTYGATIRTTKGTITVSLRAESAPRAVNSFVFLARNNFFNGNEFFFIASERYIRTGDPGGQGALDAGYTLKVDTPPATSGIANRRGTLAMVPPADPPDIFGSQFIISTADNDFLDGVKQRFVPFGDVTGGLDVAEAIAKLPVGRDNRPTERVTIVSVTISERPR